MNQDQPNQVSNEWFTSTLTPLPETPKSSKFPKKLLFALVLLGVIGGATLLAYFITKPSGVACLSQNDYSALSDEMPDDTVTPQDTFYTYLASYTNAAATKPFDADYPQFISKLSQLYKDKSKTTSIIITVTSDHDDSIVSQARATERSELIKSNLTSSGIDSKNIKIEKSAKLSPSEVDETTIFLSTIKITSAAECK